jgi:hypothetical protein
MSYFEWFIDINSATAGEGEYAGDLRKVSIDYFFRLAGYDSLSCVIWGMDNFELCCLLSCRSLARGTNLFRAWCHEPMKKELPIVLQ